MERYKYSPNSWQRVLNLADNRVRARLLGTVVDRIDFHHDTELDFVDGSAVSSPSDSLVMYSTLTSVLVVVLIAGWRSDSGRILS
jgi:hypothetical protein